MSIKPDIWIKAQCRSTFSYERLIEPFLDHSVKEGRDGWCNVASYGLSSYGYDIRCDYELKIFDIVNRSDIDFKKLDESRFINGELYVDKYVGKYFIIPPNSFALASSIEYLRIPRNVVGLMTVKSSYARCGIISPPTVLEAGWHGKVTIEISNTTPLPARVYAGEGISQILFFESSQECQVSYDDRGGKYQGQSGITMPK